MKTWPAFIGLAICISVLIVDYFNIENRFTIGIIGGICGLFFSLVGCKVDYYLEQEDR